MHQWKLRKAAYHPELRAHPQTARYRLAAKPLLSPLRPADHSTRKTRVSASVPVRLMLQPGSRLTRRPHYPSRGHAGAHRVWLYISEAEVEVWCALKVSRYSSASGAAGGGGGGAGSEGRREGVAV